MPPINAANNLGVLSLISTLITHLYKTPSAEGVNWLTPPVMNRRGLKGDDVKTAKRLYAAYLLFTSRGFGSLWIPSLS